MTAHSPSLHTTLQSFAARAPGIWRLDGCGVTRADTPMPALVHRDAYVPRTPRRRVLLLGGLSGHADDATPKREIERIRGRLKQAQEHYETWQRHLRGDKT